jgi:hypothetical protein
MGTKNETESIRQSVHVDCPVEEAFRLFRERFGEWWPGDDSERDAVEGGSVTVWDPPGRIEFTWRREDHDRVSVEFDREAEGTRVTLTHSGWERAGVATCASRFAGFVCEQMLAAV